MTRDCRFSLLVVASADGFIARAPGHTPQDWASAEEQALFFQRVSGADWSVMGRRTHEAAPRPDRRRIVFSTGAPEPDWRAARHLWLDPARLAPADLPGLVEARHRLGEAVVLGGTAVHDWFHAHGRLDRVWLTIEPMTFGSGLPVFSGQGGPDARAAFLEKGYRIVAEENLNAAGTTLLTLTPARRRGEPVGRDWWEGQATKSPADEPRGPDRPVTPDETLATATQPSRRGGRRL